MIPLDPNFYNLSSDLSYNYDRSHIGLWPIMKQHLWVYNSENRFVGSFYHTTCRVKRVKRFFEKSAFWDRLITIPIEAFSLLGRLEGLGTGGAVALNRRSFAAQQEQMWSRQRQAHAICVKQGRELLRRGQFRQVSCETSLFLVFVLFFYFGF